MKHRLLTLLLCATPALSLADLQDRLYDFNDSYYAANGINVANLGGRKVAPSKNAVIDIPFFSYQKNVRILATNVGYGASGSPIFFTVLGGGGSEIFTNDAAGQKAHQIADSYIEYFFPQKGGNPVGLPNGRQSLLHTNNNGYQSNDPLGLWLHVFVNYTPAAFNTKDGQKALADLQKKNGLALDGTPLIKSSSDIDNLYSKGFVTKLTTNDATRYAVCPEIRDPRGGAIAPDDIANFILLPNGLFLEPTLQNDFLVLQKTGNWPKNP